MSEFIDAKLSEARARLEELETQTTPIVEAYKSIEPQLMELDEVKFVIEKLEPFVELEETTRKPEVMEVVEPPRRHNRPPSPKETPKVKSKPRKPRRQIQVEMLELLKKTGGSMELEKLYHSFRDTSSRNMYRAVSNMQQKGMIKIADDEKRTVTLLKDKTRVAA